MSDGLRYQVEQWTVDGWVEMASTHDWEQARELMLYLRRESSTGMAGVRILDMTKGSTERVVLAIR